eukprot:m.135487 g.135487  ORF g.135487 m.135487 type:complete len:148 (+) comp22601_c0_seq1:1649-2092(+)
MPVIMPPKIKMTKTTAWQAFIGEVWCATSEELQSAVEMLTQMLVPLHRASLVQACNQLSSNTLRWIGSRASSDHRFQWHVSKGMRPRKGGKTSKTCTLFGDTVGTVLVVRAIGIHCRTANGKCHYRLVWRDDADRATFSSDTFTIKC